MATMRPLFSPIAALLPILLMTACGNDEPHVLQYAYSRADSLPQAYLSELSKVRTSIELTAGLFAALNANGYTYQEKAMLSPEKSSGFGTSEQQAMGIGAYCSSLVYATSFGHQQTAINQTRSLRELAGRLDISEAFDEKMLEGLTSADSSLNKSIILTKAYLNAKDQLFSEERAQMATFMAVGGWLEGMMLGTRTMGATVGSNDLRVGFWELCCSVDRMIKMAEVFPENQQLQQLALDLRIVKQSLVPIINQPRNYTMAQVKAAEKQVHALHTRLL